MDFLELSWFFSYYDFFFTLELYLVILPNIWVNISSLIIKYFLSWACSKLNSYNSQCTVPIYKNRVWTPYWRRKGSERNGLHIMCRATAAAAGGHPLLKLGNILEGIFIRRWWHHCVGYYEGDVPQDGFLRCHRICVNKSSMEDSPFARMRWSYSSVQQGLALATSNPLLGRLKKHRTNTRWVGKLRNY